MLKILAAKPATKHFKNEIISYLPMPDLTYEELESDLDHLEHLKCIKDIDLLIASDGIIIKCRNKADGFLASVYMLRKQEMLPRDKNEDDSDYEDDFPHGDTPYDANDEDSDPELDREELHSFIYNDGDSIVNLPIVGGSDFKSALMSHARIEGHGALNYMFGEQQRSKRPFWLDGKFPLIVYESLTNSFMAIDADSLKQVAGRFIIYIMVDSSDHVIQYKSDFLNTQQERILFELDYALCNCEEPSIEYYTLVLNECCKVNGYTLDMDLDQKKVIENLKSYRGRHFEGATDIVTLVEKAVRRKKDKSTELRTEDFDLILTTQSLIKHNETVVQSSARAKLDQMVGLESVKSQLYRIIDNLKFAKQRQSLGYKTADIPTSLCFLGNPGSCKTTVARILGEILFEENILLSRNFKEVSRKDLIGSYVGHTAPKVAQVFESALQGVLFIDESYALMPTENSDSYSEECIAELIIQLENTANSTITIFAGYPDKMRDFIQTANPGLRSRLTSIVEFPDYDPIQMALIFEHLLSKEEFILEDRIISQQLIKKFVTNIQKLGSKDTGNGRLMRKLFKTSVSYMAERPDHDLKTIKLCDIQRAIEEIRNAEVLLSSKEIKRVGFNNS